MKSYFSRSTALMLALFVAGYSGSAGSDVVLFSDEGDAQEDRITGPELTYIATTRYNRYKTLVAVNLLVDLGKTEGSREIRDQDSALARMTQVLYGSLDPSEAFFEKV